MQLFLTPPEGCSALQCLRLFPSAELVTPLDTSWLHLCYPFGCSRWLRFSCCPFLSVEEAAKPCVIWGGLRLEAGFTKEHLQSASGYSLAHLTWAWRIPALCGCILVHGVVTVHWPSLDLPSPWTVPFAHLFPGFIRCQQHPELSISLAGSTPALHSCRLYQLPERQDQNFGVMQVPRFLSPASVPLPPFLPVTIPCWGTSRRGHSCV